MNTPNASLALMTLRHDKERVVSLQIALKRTVGYLKGAVDSAMDHAKKLDAELRFRGLDGALEAELNELRNQCRQAAQTAHDTSVTLQAMSEPERPVSEFDDASRLPVPGKRKETRQQERLAM